MDSIAPSRASLAPAPSSPPALTLLLREIGAFAHMRVASSIGPAVALEPHGRGRPVVVVPGFLASDRTTARLRRSLEKAGYKTHGWGLGRNRGVQADLLDRLEAHMDSLGLDQPAILIGWSLGGLIAREYAKHAPHRVAKVITLGSPFSGDMRANNAWRVYERVTGHPVDCPPVACNLAEKPPVPTLACWSLRDGVVSPQSARGHASERDRAHEFDCTHMAYVANPRAIRHIARLIAD